MVQQDVLAYIHVSLALPLAPRHLQQSSFHQVAVHPLHDLRLGSREHAAVARRRRYLLGRFLDIDADVV